MNPHRTILAFGRRLVLLGRRPGLQNCGLALVACTPNLLDPDPEVMLLPPIVGAPTIQSACNGPPTAGRRLAITTTDFATGALTIVDTKTLTSSPDVALGSTDAKPFAHGDYLYLLHRFQIDALDVIDPNAGWTLVDQQAIETQGSASANPQTIAFSSDDRAYIPLFGKPSVLVYDLEDPRHPLADGAFDLRPVADADGNPEASLALVCDDVLLVSLQFLDPSAGFRPRRDNGEVAIFDRASGRLYDLDPNTEGIQGIPLRGSWARQWRLDARDPSGHSLLVLSEGIERIDLDTWTSSWVIAPDVLAELGISSYLQPQAFALTAEGQALYLASYTEDFAEVVVDRFLLGEADQTSDPVRVLAGLQTSEQTLEITAGTLWIGDRSPGASGVLGFKLGIDPSAPLQPLHSEPLTTGLPPYAITLVP